MPRDGLMTLHPSVLKAGSAHRHGNRVLHVLLNSALQRFLEEIRLFLLNLRCCSEVKIIVLVEFTTVAEMTLINVLQHCVIQSCYCQRLDFADGYSLLTCAKDHCLATPGCHFCEVGRLLGRSV